MIHNFLGNFLYLEGLHRYILVQSNTIKKRAGS